MDQAHFYIVFRLFNYLEDIIAVFTNDVENDLLHFVSSIQNVNWCIHGSRRTRGTIEDPYRYNFVFG